MPIHNLKSTLTSLLYPYHPPLPLPKLKINPNFVWNDRFHGAVEPFWIWVEVGLDDYDNYDNYDNDTN